MTVLPKVTTDSVQLCQSTDDIFFTEVEQILNFTWK